MLPALESLLPLWPLLLGASVPSTESAQETPPPVVADAEEAPWEPLNRVSVTVNSEAITESALMSALFAGAQPVSTQQEVQERLARELSDRVERLLMEQAGRDLGFEPAILEDNVDRMLALHRENLGRDRLAAFLQARHLTSTEYRDFARREVYATLWERAVTGRDAGPTGRLSRDRYVRPGEIWREYVEHEDELAEPTQVVLQQLGVRAAAVGSLEAARETIGELRQRIMAGEDFAQLAEIYGGAPPGSGGILDPLAEHMARLYPELGAFLDGAEPGQISDILPFRRGETLVGYVIVKLLERRRSEPVSFGDQAQQDALKELIEGRRDRYRVQSALLGLLEGSFVWPEEVFRPRDPAAEDASGG